MGSPPFCLKVFDLWNGSIELEGFDTANGWVALANWLDLVTFTAPTEDDLELCIVCCFRGECEAKLQPRSISMAEHPPILPTEDDLEL